MYLVVVALEGELAGGVFDVDAVAVSADEQVDGGCAYGDGAGMHVEFQSVVAESVEIEVGALLVGLFLKLHVIIMQWTDLWSYLHPPQIQLTGDQLLHGWSDGSVGIRSVWLSF